MPYEWIHPDTGGDSPVELHLWPHRSLPRKGFVFFIAVTACLLTLPLTAVLGSAVLWGLLPFILVAISGVWWALSHSYRTGRTIEVLRLWQDRVELTRRDPDGTLRQWQANPYWCAVAIHPAGGRVPHYLTLKGGGREVEIGAFLSEEERQRLYRELAALLPARSR